MPKRVIIDTDPGVDDALALILALASPELRVEAICTTFGNVSLEQATRNVFTILLQLHAEPRPLVARGAAAPLAGPPVGAQHVHGEDGLGDISKMVHPDGTPLYPGPGLPDAHLEAADVYLDLLKRHPGELTLIMLGPLTNLARLLEADAGRVMSAREVIVMGGAIRVSGNVTPAAEFNIFADPHAARSVFASDLPVTLVPLDVTQKVCLNQLEIGELADAAGEALGPFLRHITAKTLDFMAQTYGTPSLYLHDPLAVGAAIEPSILQTTGLHVDVETEGNAARGMTVADLRAINPELKKGPNMRVALDVDAGRFLALFKERVCRASS